MKDRKTAKPTPTATSAALTTFDRAALYSTVTVTGASIMVIELLGTRIIAPFYGTSLYVWSSLIAVTMLALAAGYFAGGWCADRVPWLRLSHVLLAGGILTLIVPHASGPVLALTNEWGMRAGAFFSSLALFLPPLTCLAMAGPYVIKLSTRELAGVGTTSGSVYAVSTIGSVAGTLLLGFFLLPLWGTRNIIAGTGIALLVLATAFAWYERRRLQHGGVAASTVAAGLMLIVYLGAPLAPVREADGFTVRHEAESTYGWVRVVDDERRDIRLLLSDNSSIGAVQRATGRSVLGYQQILLYLPMLKQLAESPAEHRALLIGLGAGFVAAQLKAQGITTDTIEIDPAVAQAAYDFFGYKPTGAFIVGDGRYEVQRLGGHYDLIIHDCFTGGTEPVHLLTREMMTELRDLLADDGVLALNFVGFKHGEGANAVASVARTLREVFPEQRVFVTMPNEDFTDFVFLASRHPVEFKPRNDEQARGLVILSQYEANAPTEGGIVLTDDYNPLEHMQVRKTELYRKVFMERIAPELLLR